MTTLTPRQQAVLNVITRFQVAHDGLSPSLRDIRTALRLKTESAILKHVDALARKGAISRPSRSRRSTKRAIGITPEAKRLLSARWTAQDFALGSPPTPSA